ncbi:UNVERIFIED_CONTAM: hypothetical protein HHA_286100 [Hammondia hammondi]|eukprot:XP_008884136.1 hypothetical protein HHA_286100 [Hammondia hammondi]
MQKLRLPYILVEVARSLVRAHTGVDLIVQFEMSALPNEKAEDASFIAGTFYGVLANAPFLRPAVTALVQQRTTGTQKNEQGLYMVIMYLLVFKIDEIGYQTFASLVRSCPALPMYLLLEFLFNEEALTSAARSVWLRHYDAAYVDQVLVPQTQKHAEPLSDLVESLRNLSMAAAAASANKTKSNELNRGEPSCAHKNISDMGKLSRLLADSGYVENAEQDSTVGHQDQDVHSCSCSENATLLQPWSAEARAAIHDRKDPPVSSVHSGEKKPANSTPRCPSPIQTTQGNYGQKSRSTQSLGSKETKGEGFYRQSREGSVSRQQQQQQLADGHEMAAGYPLAQAGAPRHCGDSHGPLTETETEILLTAGEKKAISEEAKEVEREEDEEEEDLWPKDVDGEESFFGRKTEREKQELPKQQAGDSSKLLELLSEEWLELKEAVATARARHAESMSLVTYNRAPSCPSVNPFDLVRAAFKQWTMQRPSNRQRLVDEAEARFRRDCTFRPMTPRKMPVFNQAEAPNEYYKLTKQFEIDKRDAREFTEWQQKERRKQEEQRIKNVAKKRAEAQLARAQGIHAAALLRLRKATSVRDLRKAAFVRQMLQREKSAEEHAQLVHRARAARESRHVSIEAAKQAAETRRQHAANEKVKRSKERARSLRLAAEERTSKHAEVVKLRSLEEAVVKTGGLISRVGRRDDWNETNGLSSPTMNGMPLVEVKARLEIKKIFEKKKRQKAERQKLSQELRTQKIKNEFLRSTKLNMERQVQEQQMNGAERRAENMSKQVMKKAALMEGIKRRERYQRMANKAIAEVKEASKNAERARRLLTLQQQQRELKHEYTDKDNTKLMATT